MKKTIYNLLLLAIGVTGCSKDVEIPRDPIAAINITNVVVGGKVLRFNTNIRDSITNMNFKIVGVPAGSDKLLKVYPSGSPNNLYYNSILNSSGGDYYSLFVGGVATGTVDALMIKDNYTNYRDSVFAVRFVNMVQNSLPISINLLGGANGSEHDGLNYKTASTFKVYNADYKPEHNTYSFQIRDKTTGTLLSTYTFKPTAPSANPLPRFQSVTLVWKGTVGGTGTATPSILRVNNY